MPQGSVLGPVLSLLYVNGIPNVIQSEMKMFADDAKVYRMITKDNDVESLQNDVDNLEKWSETWLLEFNTSKCKVMHCGSSNPKMQYFMNKRSRKLEETLVERDLGVTVQANKTMLDTSRKATSAMTLLKISFSSLTVQNFKILFTTYVRPHLEYYIYTGSSSWTIHGARYAGPGESATKSDYACTVHTTPYIRRTPLFLKTVVIEE